MLTRDKEQNSQSLRINFGVTNMAHDEDLDVLYKPLSEDEEQERRGCNKRRCVERLYLFSLIFMLASILYYGYVLLRCQHDDMLSCFTYPNDEGTAYTPEQLHLSLGANDNEYYVTWATQRPTDTYLIWYKMPIKEVHAVKGRRTDGHFDSQWVPGTKYHKYSYRAKMGGADMVPDAQYKYRVVACYDTKDNHTVSICDTLARENPRELENKASKSSGVYNFTSRPYDDPTRTLRLIFYGDLGLLNAQSVPRLVTEIEGQDLIIHNGDFAYDLDTQNGEYGDKFMRLMEQVAARVPYQTSVGNHEIAGNFSEYNHRFTMINRGPVNHGAHNNFFYSFNAGPIHFVAISTEFYYFLQHTGLAPLVYQYNWLEEDLKLANRPEERAKRPWIVIFGHRPMYCSSKDGDDCSRDSNLLRRGLPFVGGYALEKLFYDHGVDVELYSHEHQYERFLPIYDGKVHAGSPQDPYWNPQAPVHLISGSAGCQEKLDPFMGNPMVGSVKRISDYGFTKIRASRCRIEFKQISDDQKGSVVDEFVLAKDQQNFPARGQKIDGC